MRGSAAWFAREHGHQLHSGYDLVFASAYLPLTDLLAFAPALAGTPTLLYFHENQLAFPVRAEFSGERDHHYGFTQLTSGLAATRCAFNSAHNRDSFLEAGRAVLERMPDAVPADWIDAIAAKSVVLPLPVEYPDPPSNYRDTPREARTDGPLILWNHRWEYDKNPESFFGALFELAAREVPFRVAVCGQRFRKAPPIFDQARERLGARVVAFGEQPRGDYLEWARRAQLCVSTAIHEFFGLAMLEATHLGAAPLVPDRLSYVELFPREYRYADRDLVERLESLCRAWVAGRLDLRADRRSLTAPLGTTQVLPAYLAAFRGLAG